MLTRVSLTGSLGLALLAAAALPAVAQDRGGSLAQAEWAQNYDSAATMRVQRSNTPILSPQTLAATEQMVERYRDIVARGGWQSVSGAERLRVGSKSPAVTSLRQRLIASGDLDPAVLFQLARRADMSIADLDTLLNKRSGLLGLAGVSDMRDIGERRDAGDPAAQLAFDVYVHRLRAYAGAYLAQLDGVDVISFTAGVGENSIRVREEAMATLGFAGVEIDPDRNATRERGIRRISSDSSRVEVLVVPTNEELEIARQTLSVTS